MGLGLFRLILSIWVIDHHFAWSRTYIEPWFTQRFGERHFGYLGIGHVAVICFFVLSGYVITWVLNNKYPLNAAGVKAFLVGRFIRIYPLYWAMLAIIIVAMAVAVGWNSDLPQLRMDRIVGDLLLVPYGVIGFFHFFNRYAYGMIDVPAWTLPYDFLFYLLAPWMVTRKRVLVAVIVFELVYLTILAALGPQPLFSAGDGRSWHEGYFTSGHSTILAFCIGALGYYYRQIRFSPPALGAAILALLYMTYAPFGLTNFYLNQLLVMLVALALVLGLKQRSKLDNLLGELTYSTYLIHVPLLESLNWLGAGYGGLLALPLTYLLAFATVRYFEMPLEKRRADLTRTLLSRPEASIHRETLGGSRIVLTALAALLVASASLNLIRLAL
ncbi:MAG TPA: acyltransferase [Gammaproteobacteria bacterium]|nr:acyltransferase [Gammaproteobacteria bacterium]